MILLRATSMRLASYMLAGLLFFVAGGRVAIADEKTPAPASSLHFTSPVYDETNTLTPEQKAALERRLYFYADSTSTQIQIAIIKTTNGIPINEYAVDAAQANHIGQAKKNNGALIMLAKDDHKAFIATGYGLEPTLTDATLSIIYQDILRPHLKDGDFYGGLDSTITAMIHAVNGEFKVQSGDKLPSRNGGRSSSGRGAWGFVVILFIVFIIIRAIAGTGIRRTVVGAGGGGSGCLGGILQGLFWSSIFNSGRGGGWGGGGSSGGGFGGWSGGGGSFGGGGAGGDW